MAQSVSKRLSFLDRYLTGGNPAPAGLQEVLADFGPERPKERAFPGPALFVVRRRIRHRRTRLTDRPLARVIVLPLQSIS